MAQFNVTTGQKNGLIQMVERWTRHQHGEATGDLLLDFTDEINGAFEDIMPLLLAYNDKIRWDDTVNHTDKPIGNVDIVANQNDYLIAQDDNSLDILNINYVRAIKTTGDTKYYDLEKITSDDSRVSEILSPDTAVTGQPTGYLELGNRIYLDILPDSNVTNGLEIGFQREQYYFLSTDTTKEAGIPKPFHRLLAYIAALNWNLVNRTDDTALIQILRGKIEKKEGQLEEFIRLRNPSNVEISTKRQVFR